MHNFEVIAYCIAELNAVLSLPKRDSENNLNLIILEVTSNPQPFFLRGNELFSFTALEN